MTEKTGETVRDSGEFRCEKCGATFTLSRGLLMPACPNCGFDTFDIHNPRFTSVNDAANERARKREG
jgi:predicted  nucleic acid-binding Zn-ribbon protein